MDDGAIVIPFRVEDYIGQVRLALTYGIAFGANAIPKVVHRQEDDYLKTNAGSENGRLRLLATAAFVTDPR